MPTDEIPIYSPLLDDKETEYVLQAMKSGWISSRGEFVSQFEERFAQRIGLPYGTTCTNGTVALHLALMAVGVDAGDEVIVPNFSYVALANSVRHAGAVPVLCDVNLDTWQADIKSIISLMSSRTKAIILVHTYGGVAQVEELISVAKKAGVFIIEDCAEAIGSINQGSHVGRLGDIATFSFFGNKTITTGEGGFIGSNDESIIKLVRRLKNQGVAEGERYFHDLLAYNYRMTNVACAIGCAQLEKLDYILSRKREIWDRYLLGLKDTPLIPQKSADHTSSSNWLCCFRMPEELNAGELMRFLLNKGIDSRPGFCSLSSMPMYSQSVSHGQISAILERTVICLPSFPGLLAEQQARIIEEIKLFFGEQYAILYNGE